MANTVIEIVISNKPFFYNDIRHSIMTYDTL